MNNSREKFEAWYECSEDVTHVNTSRYFIAKSAWQAATEQSQKEIAELEANNDKVKLALASIRDIFEYDDEMVRSGALSFPEDVAGFVKTKVAELQAREKELVNLAKLTYGYLWHINAGLDAPAILNVTSITPEKCSHIVRKLWLDVLTKEQRGEGINKALEALANVRGE